MFVTYLTVLQKVRATQIKRITMIYSEVKLSFDVLILLKSDPNQLWIWVLLAFLLHLIRKLIQLLLLLILFIFNSQQGLNFLDWLVSAQFIIVRPIVRFMVNKAPTQSTGVLGFQTILYYLNKTKQLNTSLFSLLLDKQFGKVLSGFLPLLSRKSN